jgi:sulfur transfer complex TusBCD TusB component (DsrH family)
LIPCWEMRAKAELRYFNLTADLVARGLARETRKWSDVILLQPGTG